MILGQSADTAAAPAIDDAVPLQEVDYDQEVDYEKLRTHLLADGQKL